MHQHEQNGKNLWLRNKINYVHQRYCDDKRRICEFSPCFPFGSPLLLFFPTLSLLENYVQQACISITKVVSECHLGALLQLTGTNINLLSVATTRLTCELLSGRRVAPFDSNNKIIFLNLQIVHYRCTSEHCMLE